MGVVLDSLRFSVSLKLWFQDIVILPLCSISRAYGFTRVLHAQALENARDL